MIDDVDHDRVEWDSPLTEMVDSQKQKRKLKRADQIPHKEAKQERKRRAVTDSQESIPIHEINVLENDSDDDDFRSTFTTSQKLHKPVKRTKRNDTSKTSKYDNHTDKRISDNDNKSRNSNNTNKLNTSHSRITANNDNNKSSSQDSVTRGNGFDPNNGLRSTNSTLFLPERKKKDDHYNDKSNSKSSLVQDSVNHDDDDDELDVILDALESRTKLIIPEPRKTVNRINVKDSNKNSSASSSQDSTARDSDVDSVSSRSKLILPNRRKKEDTNTNSDNNDDKLEDAERNKIMRRLEKTQRKEKEIVFTCPFCLIPFNHITSAIQKELDLMEKKEVEYKKKAMEEAKHSSFKKPDELIKRPISSKEKQAFCRLHNHELVIKPTGIKNGYPVDLNFGELKERIMKLTLELDDVVYKRIPSDYRKVVVDAYDSLGKNKARTPMMMMKRIELLSPGYYGPRGAAIMLDVLSDIYLKSGKLSKQLAHPLLPLEYVQQVLIPEAAYRLIRQDIIKKHRSTGTGKPLANANAKAKSIMLESCQFGEAMYPMTEDKEDLIEDSTYQQQLEKERKRKNDYPIVIED